MFDHQSRCAGQCGEHSRRFPRSRAAGTRRQGHDGLAEFRVDFLIGSPPRLRADGHVQKNLLLQITTAAEASAGLALAHGAARGGVPRAEAARPARPHHYTHAAHRNAHELTRVPPTLARRAELPPGGHTWAATASSITQSRGRSGAPCSGGARRRYARSYLGELAWRFIQLGERPVGTRRAARAIEPCREY